jgi:putative transposase
MTSKRDRDRMTFETTGLTKRAIRPRAALGGVTPAAGVNAALEAHLGREIALARERPARGSGEQAFPGHGEPPPSRSSCAAPAPGARRSGRGATPEEQPRCSSPAGHHAWRDRPASDGRPRHDALPGEIRAAHAELATRGPDCCVNTVAKLVRDHGIQARAARHFRRTADSNHDLPVAEKLLGRPFNPEPPNEAGAADVTYLPTRQGWLWRAAVEDLCSRRVVGRSAAAHLESRPVVAAPALPGEGLLARSGRGSQCASDRDQNLLARHGITCGTSRRAGCRANAPMENFLASLKKGLAHGADLATRADARAAVVEHIEVFYNTRRRHPSLGHLSPAEDERAEQS